MTRTFTAALVAGILLAACGGQAGREAGTARGSRSEIITREQIEKGRFTSAYAAVEALHNNWLIVRNVTTSLGAGKEAPPTRQTPAGPVVTQPVDENRAPPGMNVGIQVYLDGVRLGGVEDLRRISTQSVQSIRHYTAQEAQVRFGIGHSNGAIVVATTRDTPPE
jgi:hypothetical protein